MVSLRNILLFGVAFSTLFSVQALANKGKVSDNNVNIRTASSQDSNIYGRLDMGQTLDIIGIQGEFYNVNFDGRKDLFVSNKYVDLVEAYGLINSDGVNIRNNPSTSSSIITKVSAGEKLLVNGISGEFYAVNYNGTTAFVHKDFIKGELLTKIKTQVKVQSEDKSKTGNSSQDKIYAQVSTPDGLRLREKPSQESSIITVLDYGMPVDVIKQEDKWVKVSLDGLEGYLSKDFVEIKQGEKPVFENSKADAIIAYGKQFLGTPYSWGGTDLRRGVDCSGFVYSVMKNFGVYLSRSSRQQVNNGTKIDKKNLKKGDLVFFDTTGGNNGSISHVGIYIGDGQFIHSSSSKRTWGITISSLSEAYYIRTYVTASRVLN